MQFQGTPVSKMGFGVPVKKVSETPESQIDPGSLIVRDIIVVNQSIPGSLIVADVTFVS